ncbi:hypothetical protein M3197_04990 [Sporosarcina aquimarina]|uniref:hypothetical protein n=1 Tax=Sporosarcina aquimarina TaxID=114975 RepID=UPI00203C8E34|nr:hypothetical protein [Sporosarcina aquimarina]MCM3756840.1 hypothetical protein [Sporosarcina aquimarina]
MNHEQKVDELEKLLHSMPKIKDERSKEEVLERLKNDKRLTKTPAVPLRKKSRVVPLIVAVAAVLLVAILIPTFMSSMDTGKQSADEASIESDSEGVPATAREDEEMENFSKDFSSKSAVSMGDDSQYAVYPADLDGGRILHIGLQDAQAVSIPVSILLSKEQLEAKGVTEDSTDLEIYKAFAGELDEEALGFEPMHPLDATFSEKGDQLTVLLSDTHGYDLSAATQEVFLHSLMQTFPSYRNIRILDGYGQPADFDQVGELEPIDIQTELTNTPYYVYTLEDGQQVLSPNFMQQAESFKEALNLMQTAPNDLYDPVIPKEMDFTVTVNEGIAEVKFNNVVQLDSMPLDVASQLIDGLTLTAASFNLQLKVVNVEPLDWNGLNFRGLLPKAIGANPMPFILK